MEVKKTIKAMAIFLISLILVIVLTGCGKKENTKSNDIKQTQSTSQEQKENKVETNKKEEEWGVGPTKLSLLTSDTSHKVFVKFPQLLPNAYATGWVAKQEDGTMVIADTRNPEHITEDAQNVDEVLPKYFTQTIRIMKRYRNNNWENFSFEITKQKHMTVKAYGGVNYEMCKYWGIHHCTFKGEAEKHFFVAYSALVNDGKDYVYWMVLDASKEQSLHETVEYNADQMAKTLSDKPY